MLRRIPFVLLALIVLLLSALLLPGIRVYALTATLPARTFTPTVTPSRSPTAACTVPAYYVTVTPSATTVQAGAQITVSAYSNVGIASYTLSIIDNATGIVQSDTDPIFTPTTNASMSAPAQWTLTAVRAGSVSFRVGAYGEIAFCSGGNSGWTWGGASGISGSVTVTDIATPTPTAPAGALPDLSVVSITEFGYTPVYPTPTAFACWMPARSALGLRVTIQNTGTAAAGSFILDLNGSQQTISGLAVGQILAVDFKIPLPRTRTATVDITGLVAESDETNNVYSLVLSAATSTRTGTPLPTICTTLVASSTPTVTATPTKTMTPTITLTTPPVGGACSPVSATITAPFSKDGAGTFCWQSSNLGTYVNSWNMAALTINGVNFANTWAPASSYPAKIGGYWYVMYAGNFAWSHFEAK